MSIKCLHVPGAVLGAQKNTSHLTDGETEAQRLGHFSLVYQAGTHRTDPCPGQLHSKDSLMLLENRETDPMETMGTAGVRPE